MGSLSVTAHGSSRRLLEVVTPGFRRLTGAVEAVVEGARDRYRHMLESATEYTLTLYCESLRKAVLAEERRLPGVVQDEEVVFALYEFAPMRIAEMREHLVYDDAERLVQFWDFASTAGKLARARVTEAEDAVDVADAVMVGVDDLRRYLIAHDLLDHAFVLRSAKLPVAERWHEQIHRDAGRRSTPAVQWGRALNELANVEHAPLADRAPCS